MPIRRGHLPSPGTYRTTLAGLLAEGQDVAAGISYLKGLSVVDSNRIVVSGASNGGIMALLAADQGLGLRAAIAFAPGAEGWANIHLRANKVLPHQAKLYPAYGTTHQDGHWEFATMGFSVWGQNVLAFIGQAFARA